MDRKPMIGEVSLEDLLERLAFAEEEARHAAVEQPKLFMAAASYRIRKLRKRQKAEMAAEQLRVDTSLRKRFRYKGKKGITEKFIAEMVAHSPEVRQAELEAAEAKASEEWAKHLLEAYEHRRTSLKILAQYAFLDDGFSGKREVNRLAEKRERLKREFRYQEDREEGDL